MCPGDLQVTPSETSLEASPGRSIARSTRSQTFADVPSMRILQLIPQTKVGGLETYSFNISAEFARRGHDVLLLANRNNGLLFDRDRVVVGVHSAVGSNTTTFAEMPASRGRPCLASRPAMLAGPMDIRSKKRSMSSATDVFTAAAAHSSPVTPGGASSNAVSFSAAAWGA